MLAVPDLDARWEHHPSHFWLVLGVAVLNVVLGVLVARPRDSGATRDCSWSRWCCSRAPASWHCMRWRHRAWCWRGPTAVSRWRRRWGCWWPPRSPPPPRSSSTNGGRRSCSACSGLCGWRSAPCFSSGPRPRWSESPPLERTVEAERAPWLLVLLPFGVGAYAFAAWRYIEIYRNRRRLLPLAVASAFVLLAEALVTVAFGRAWHASWWEWHLLMAAAFGLILVAARNEYRAERSLTGAFGGLYLERTLEQLDARESAALAELTRAEREGTLDAAVPRARPGLLRERGGHAGALRTRAGARGWPASPIRGAPAGRADGGGPGNGRAGRCGAGGLGAFRRPGRVHEFSARDVRPARWWRC